ncbi:RcnB family protein [Steroidobacter sp. S1-65]|uniref:RcnB family protein n=1 Tax=Steroidobacter gossypii TaxID=2805490 RepID=A0ABS1X3V2_9GAMM|nr:RcnB family protein [Steroidobacter gossypii]MBM0107900.1 RcnB family protein [Steroidobacter gossypii]
MKTLFAAAVAVSLLTGTAATAYADNDRGRHYERRHDDRGKDRREHRGHHDRKDWDRKDHKDWDRHRGHDRYDRRDAYRHGYWQGRADQRRYDRGRYNPPRGYYVRSWRHGDHLPRAYCESRYIVHDYHAYHLSPPPRGHHWVRVNNDVVLAAVASGLVVSVVNGLFY